MLAFFSLTAADDCCSVLALCGGTGGGGGGGGGGGNPYAWISDLPKADVTPTKVVVYGYMIAGAVLPTPYTISYKGFIRYDYNFPPNITSHTYSVYETHLWVAVNTVGPFAWNLAQELRVRFGGITARTYSYSNLDCGETPCILPPPLYPPGFPSFPDGYAYGAAARFVEEYGGSPGMNGDLWTSARVLNGLNPGGADFWWQHQIRWNTD